MTPAEIGVVVGRAGTSRTMGKKSLIGMVPVKSDKIERGGIAVRHFKNHKHGMKGIAFVPQGRMISSNMIEQKSIESGLVANNTPAVALGIYMM